jgi:hypothetical protein
MLLTLANSCFNDISRCLLENNGGVVLTSTHTRYGKGIDAASVQVTRSNVMNRPSKGFTVQVTKVLQYESGPQRPILQRLGSFLGICSPLDINGNQVPMKSLKEI